MKRFARFPWTLYKGDPNWVPPLVSAYRHKLDRRKNPTWRHLQGEYFIAWRGGQPVGTIAAFINHRHNQFHGERIGFFGCFEVYDDPDAANALLDAAARYVESLGCTAIRGPANFSINDEFGLLVKGFDDPPVFVMPYNHPYYARLLENAPGFRRVMNLYSYNITLRRWLASDKLRQTIRLTHKNNARREITVRTLDPQRVRRDLKIIRTIYNNTWDDNWGFVPLSDSELDDMITAIRRYMDPRLVVFAEVRGEPVGFLMAFPDLNQPLRHVRARPGKPELVSSLQLLWHWKLRSKITRIRIPLMGIKADYRGIGVEAAMFVKLYEQALALSDETGWQHADAGWVLEANVPMQRIMQGYGGEDYKHYCLYERALTPARSAAAETLPARPRRMRARRNLPAVALTFRRKMAGRRLAVSFPVSLPAPLHRLDHGAQAIRDLPRRQAARVREGWRNRGK